MVNEPVNAALLTFITLKSTSGLPRLSTSSGHSSCGGTIIIIIIIRGRAEVRLRQQARSLELKHTPDESDVTSTTDSIPFF